MHSTKLDNQTALCKVDHCEHAKERCKDIPLNAVSIVPGGRTKSSNERQQTWTAAAPLNGNKVRWQDSNCLRLSLYDEDDVGGEVALSIVRRWKDKKGFPVEEAEARVDVLALGKPEKTVTHLYGEQGERSKYYIASSISNLFHDHPSTISIDDSQNCSCRELRSSLSADM